MYPPVLSSLARLLLSLRYSSVLFLIQSEQMGSLSARVLLFDYVAPFGSLLALVMRLPTERVSISSSDSSTSYFYIC